MASGTSSNGLSKAPNSSKPCSGLNAVPTRETLLSLLDDIELISKELIENSILPKPKKMSGADHDALTQLLVDKDRQLKHTMALAIRQGHVEKKIQALTIEVKKHDDAIKELQKKFKEAETLLSTAIFQANQKLDSISRAKESPVPSEELIKYAHRISASNAVCAPLNWQQGDPRRPYPTDIEMRTGFLGRPPGVGGTTPLHPGSTPGSSVRDPQSSFNMTSPHPSSQGPQPGPPPPPGPQGAAGGLMSPAGASGAAAGKMQAPAAVPPPVGQFAWQGGEMALSMKDGTSVSIETAGAAGGATGGEVDVMSTDSSSSSSTDSN